LNLASLDSLRSARSARAVYWQRLGGDLRRPRVNTILTDGTASPSLITLGLLTRHRFT